MAHLSLHFIGDIVQKVTGRLKEHEDVPSSMPLMEEE